MTFPSNLHELVEKVAIAKKKLTQLETEALKIPAAKNEFETLRAELSQILGKEGFPEETVDLLLAAR